MKNKIKSIIALATVAFLSMPLACGCAPTGDVPPPAWEGAYYSGESEPTKFFRKDEGDLFIEMGDGDLHEYRDGAWTKIGNLTDLPFTHNKNVSMWCGYDGFLWINGNATDVNIKDVNALGIIDDTLSLYDQDGYGGYNVSIPAREQIALVGNLGKFAYNTKYSGTIVNQIKVISKNAGALDLGTINLKTREYKILDTVDVTAGLNTLTCSISIDENSTLVLGGSNTTARLYKRCETAGDSQIGLFTTDVAKSFATISPDKTEGANDRLIIQTRATYAEDDMVSHLQTVEKHDVLTRIEGKNISIFGDSISSYAGWSNNTQTNSTLGSNGSHYKDGWNGFTVDDTWWKQLVNTTKTNLIVNNSSAGDAMLGGGKNRCVQLHNDMGINPEIICMFFGINDIWRRDMDANYSLANFKTNFSDTLNKIRTKYPNAIIFVATYLPFEWWTSTTGSGVVYKMTAQEIEEYNNYVRQQVAQRQNFYVVDLYKDSGINFDNYKNYYVNETNRWLHPNKDGMDKITDCFYNVVYNAYKNMP